MQDEKRERWMELCARIENEQDPDAVLALAKQLNEMLIEKERRLGILPDAEPKRAAQFSPDPSARKTQHDPSDPA